MVCIIWGCLYTLTESKVHDENRRGSEQKINNKRRGKLDQSKILIIFLSLLNYTSPDVR